MKRWMALLLAAALGGSLVCGCAQQNEAPGEYVVYGCVSDLSKAGGEDAVTAVESAVSGGPDEAVAEALLLEMIGLHGETYRSPLPEDLQVLAVSIENGRATVDFSAEYEDLSGLDRTMADSCIALTLCQISSVDKIRILIEGEPTARKEKDLMSNDHVLLRSMDQETRRLRLRLFYPSAETGELVSERRMISVSEGETRTAAVLEALLEGPEDPSLLEILPEKTRVVSARVEEGVCYVTLSKDFLEDVPNTLQEQENVIYSVVKSLCSVNDIQAVQIAIEGEQNAHYGKVDLRSAFS